MSGTRREAGTAPRRAAPTDGAIGAGRGFGRLLLVTGGLGALASFVLTLDGFLLLQDPGFRPVCTLGPVLSCTDVIGSEQASSFGFPPPMLGLVGYALVAAVGIGVLAGARYRPWFWRALHLGTLLGAGFCMWLMTRALYEIGALCLWCCVVWATTIVVFWYTTVHNLAHGIVRAPRVLVAGVAEFHWVVPAVWCASVLLLITTRFWDYGRGAA
ncbi:vitamin K epoxide reductase family protein [Streptomyces sp. NPDC058872]|uniref:vitamin K epoxide reductase family protein n=1 Tax=Streptomyces sp. NPDC058872 TaxID=3346661 RepID=UPI0036CED5DD